MLFQSFQIWDDGSLIKMYLLEDFLPPEELYCGKGGIAAMQTSPQKLMMEGSERRSRGAVHALVLLGPLAC